VLEFLLKNWMLVLTALVSGFFLMWPQLKGKGGAGSIGTNEAVRLINRERAVLIDVSEPDEFAKGHPNGARNIPISTLEAKLEGAKELPSNKALPLVVVCPTGSRSSRAAARLREGAGAGRGLWRLARSQLTRGEVRSLSQVGRVAASGGARSREQSCA
jgi:rhodanese-related sulfurtransferase